MTSQAQDPRGLDKNDISQSIMLLACGKRISSGDSQDSYHKPCNGKDTLLHYLWVVRAVNCTVVFLNAAIVLMADDW